jgi:hypothetical protein
MSHLSPEAAPAPIPHHTRSSFASNPCAPAPPTERTTPRRARRPRRASPTRAPRHRCVHSHGCHLCPHARAHTQKMPRGGAPALTSGTLTFLPSIPQTRTQVVWRSFADFKSLHEALRRETDKTFDVALPKQQWCVRERAFHRARKAKTPHSHLLAPPSSPNPLCRYQKFTLNFRDSAEFRRCLLDDYLKVRMMGEEASPLQAQIRRSLTPPLPKPHTPPPRRPPSPTRPPARRAPSAPSSGRRTAPTGPPRSGPSTSPCTTSRTSPP